MIKKKYLVVPSLLMILSACTGQKLNVEFKNLNEFNVGDNINACTLVKAINKTEITEDMIANDGIHVDDIILNCAKLNTEKVGKQTAIFKFGEDEYYFEYTVNDTKSPIIVADDEIKIGLNDEFKLEDHVIFSDNDVVSFVVKGNVDTTTNGKYQIKVSCKDDSGNYSEKNIWVNVGEGGEDYPLVEDTTLARDPNADKLIAEMNEKGEPQTDIPNANVEHESVNKEELFDNVIVLDPKCVSGVYEIGAETGLEAANKVMEEYDCWQVEAKPITSNTDEDPENTGKRYSVSCICSKNNAIKESGSYEPAKIESVVGENE